MILLMGMFVMVMPAPTITMFIVVVGVMIVLMGMRAMVMSAPTVAMFMVLLLIVIVLMGMLAMVMSASALTVFIMQMFMIRFFFIPLLTYGRIFFILFHIRTLQIYFLPM